MKKKILSIALSLAMLGISVVPAYASNDVKVADSRIAVSQMSTDIASLTEAEVNEMSRIGYQFNWNVKKDQWVYSTDVMNLKAGDEVGIHIVPSPSGSSIFGIYDHDTGQVQWLSKFNTTLSATVSIYVGGRYSIAIGNLSGGDMNYTGAWFY